MATTSATFDTCAVLPGATAPKTLPYSCQKCGTVIQLGRQDPVRCPNCDHRILYKMRTIKSVVIEVD